MATTATLTLLVFGTGDTPDVEVHPGVRAAVDAGSSALRSGTVDRAAITVGEANPQDVRASAAYADAVALFEMAEAGDLLLSATATAVLGPHRYRLEPRREGVTSVAWAATRRLSPLPSFLGDPESFVGRHDELASLLAIVDAVATGPTQRVLLRGEAGIGKTALAGAVAARARERSFAVLAGHCAEDLSVSYQPVADALRHVVDGMSMAELSDKIGPTAPYLAALFPKLGPPPAGASGEEARELLRHALGALLRSSAGSGPTVLVVDDIQWAPRPTLALLDDLRRDVTSSLLLIGTQRVGDGRAEPWTDDESTTVLDVGPLTREDTAALVALHSESLATRSRAVGEIHRSSAGNAFFIEELSRHMGDAGVVTDLPQSVRDVVLRRVANLAPDALPIMTAGAVIAAPFDARLLSTVTGQAEAGIAYVLDAAVNAALLVQNESGYAFQHSLARDALYESITTTRRRLLHARIADALDGPPDLVAQHVAAGATRETLDRVVDAALAAIDLEASRWASDPRPVLRNALAALRLDPRPRRDRAQLLSLLSVAEYNAGEQNAAWPIAERAAHEAREVGDLPLLARAVNDMGYTLPNDGPFDRFVALAEETLAVGRDDDTVVALVGCVLASHLSWRGNDIARATVLVERAWSSAARIDDPEMRRQALAIRSEVLSGTPHLDQRLRITEQYIDAHERAGMSVLSGGYTYRAGALLSAGCRDEFDEACGVADRFAEERPWWLTAEIALLLRGCAGLLDGRLLETLMMISPQLGTFADEGISPFVAQAALIWRENGRTADLVPLIKAIPASESTSRMIPALLALAHAELGEHDAARELLDTIAAGDFGGLFTSFATAVALAMAAEAAWHLGDQIHATAITNHLRPYGGQLIVIPPCSAAFGPADYYLGLLAETYGDPDTAAARHEAAVAMCRRVRAPLLLGHSLVALARVTGDAAPADEAREIATALDAARLRTSLDQT